MDGVLADLLGVWTKMVALKTGKKLKTLTALDMIRTQRFFGLIYHLLNATKKLLNSIKSKRETILY